MNNSLLITGGAGFIASNFVNYWVKKYPNDRIIVLDALTYAANTNSIKQFIDNKEISFIKGDINNIDLVNEILQINETSHLINFAAESHVDKSIKSSCIFMESNIIGTYNLLECFRKHWENNNTPNNWRFLQISTDEVFGSLEKNDNPFSEISPYLPRSPYSASKASSDHLVKAWFHTYGLPTLITNCSNNYGPWQFPEKLIPLTISNIIKGQKIPVYGDGLNIRDWLFVEDHCSAIDLVLSNSKPGESYCIGGNNEVKNIDLIFKLCKLIDLMAPNYQISLKNKNSAELINFVEDRKGHDKRYSINASKIKDKLNWTPKYNLDYGLVKTVEWYLENRFFWK